MTSTSTPRGLTELDAARLDSLRLMKLIASGGLVLAAVVYIVCTVVGHDHAAWPYLRAASEAAMVGGLADWFAVTALFRHPLGLPIPHTAIIPRKKDQIGESLGDFIQQNFLTPEVVAPRVRAARIPQRFGEFLLSPGRAEKLAGEMGAALAGANAVFEDEAIRQSVEAFLDAQLRRLSVAPAAAKLLEIAIAGDQHQRILTEGLRSGMRFLSDNRELFRSRLGEESPEWVPEWVDDRVFQRLFTGVQSFLADIVINPEHGLRVEFDKRLRDWAVRLRTDAETAARLDQFKTELLDNPAVRDAISAMWNPLKDTVVSAASDPDSELRKFAASVVRQIGSSLRDDPDLQAKCDGWLVTLLNHVLVNYGDELVGVITFTVQRWDAESTSRRLELQVGRDLQFIRINGTVVGSLVGLVIYSVSRLL